MTAIAGIYGETTMERKSLRAFGSLSEAAAELAWRVRDGVVAVRSGRGGHGSGVVWGKEGIVVTNEHVVAGDRAEVVMEDGTALPASVVRKDRLRDLAMLKVEATSLTAIPVGESRGLRPGQLALAVGNPLGVRGAVSVGIISGTLTEVLAGGRRFPEMVRADIDLYPGNSGGPLLDAQGQVIGINAMVTGPGAALAVPSHVVQRMLEAPTSPGPFIGVAAREVPLLAGLGTPMEVTRGRGLLVQGVMAGSPADRAGVLAGDLVIGLDGAGFGAGESVFEQIDMLQPGSTLRLSLLRGGRVLRVEVAPEWQI